MPKKTTKTVQPPAPQPSPATGIATAPKFNWLRWLEIFTDLFFVDAKTKLTSSPKFWQSVGYIAMTYAFVVYAGDNLEYMLAYGFLITSNKLASLWLERRYSMPLVGNNDTDDKKAK